MAGHKYYGSCMDCKLPYSPEMHGDLMIPELVWKRISDSGVESELICPHCIKKRAHSKVLATAQPGWYQLWLTMNDKNYEVVGADTYRWACVIKGMWPYGKSHVSLMYDGIPGPKLSIVNTSMA